MLQKTVFAISQSDTTGFIERPLCIKLGGRYDKIKDHLTVNRTLDEYVLLYCIGGKGFVEINGVKSLVDKGNIVICPQNLAHSYGGDNSDPWSIIWFHFTGEIGKYFYLQSSASKTHGVIKSVYQKSLQDQFERLLQVLSHARNFTAVLQGEAILTELLCQVIQNSKLTTKSGNLQQIYVDRTVEFLEQNYMSPISLDSIANHIGLSKYYLIRLFKEHTGSTPKEYAKSLKLKEGCRLLLESNLSISQISSMLGFSSQYHFSESFKDFSGYSPSKFRRLII